MGSNIAILEGIAVNYISFNSFPLIRKKNGWKKVFNIVAQLIVKQKSISKMVKTYFFFIEGSERPGEKGNDLRSYDILLNTFVLS